MLATLLAVAIAAALAWWSWRSRLHLPRARWAALARGVALAAVLLLLLDPGVRPPGPHPRPLVLLDNSVSMHATTGRFGEAAAFAATLGDTDRFGQLAPGEPGDRSDLYGALVATVASGRPVIVVTDGEISDAASIPPDLLAETTVRVLARRPGADIGITAVGGPDQLTVGDTLALDIELTRTAGSPDSALVIVSDSTTTLLHGTAHFGTNERVRLHLAAPLPHNLQGEHWLSIARIGSVDAEPGDDIRWWRVRVSPTPGLVVLAATPDWDARALYRTLNDVAEVPVRGYTQLQRGVWHRMDDLRLVSAADVMAAARNADLLAVRGDPTPWRNIGKGKLFWPEAATEGDWYIGPGNVSPLGGAFATVELDSLPPATGISPLDTAGGAWVGATARLSRRGAMVPVVTGRITGGTRIVTIGIDGLSRWALRGGLADQAWRVLIADAATWLLSGSSGDSARARPVSAVTQRGRPVHFRWTAAGLPTPLMISLRGPAGEHDDTLRFDNEGNAALALPVGRYCYTLTGGGAGAFAVEPYADELLPGPVTLSAHDGHMSSGSPRRSLRELLWLFGVAIAGFGVEWALRRRMGLR